MNEYVKTAMGAGGTAMGRFLNDLIVSRFGKNTGKGLGVSSLDDASTLDDWAVTTDSHTVWPLEFPGGDIGSLSVAGTVNDLSVVGAKPEALTFGLILEEGLDLSLLERILDSAKRECENAGVDIITGDTKVVEKGGVKGMVTNTAGFGRVHPLLEENNRISGRYGTDDPWLRDSGLEEGDVIICSGEIGNHGFTILSRREGYGFEGDIVSDVASVNGMVNCALETGGIVAMKDPTRGGLANLLNEWAGKSRVAITIDEERIPFNDAVLSASNLLGIDPLEVGNEGKVVFAVVPESAEDVLKAVRKDPLGRRAEIVGSVTGEGERVAMKTRSGGRRIVEPPVQDPVPRIC